MIFRGGYDFQRIHIQDVHLSAEFKGHHMQNIFKALLIHQFQQMPRFHTDLYNSAAII